MTLDLSDWEQSVTLRPWAADDYDAIRELQLRCFPRMKTWSRDHFDSMRAQFPEGQLCLVHDDRIVASASSLIIELSEYGELHNWTEVADGGYIRNHDPEGDTLYGIEMMVDPEYRGRRFARRLYEERKSLCRRRNLARMAVGGRIPGYAQHIDEMSADQYVEKVRNKELIDPVLTAQLANGFVLRSLHRDYLPSDEDSAGYATSLEWINVDHLAGERRYQRRIIEPVRVASVQFQLRRIEGFEDFARQVEFFVDVAADAKADFVVFPELFTLALLSLVEQDLPGQGARSLAQFTEQYLDLFGDLAVKYNVNIIGGSQFVYEEHRLTNVAFLFRRDGSIEKQTKIHPTPNERRWWGVQGGQSLDVFDTDRGKIAILICYDCEFPELARVAAHRGAMLLFVPYNTQDRPGHVRVRTCAQARAIENDVYVITAGCVGNLPMVDNADIHYAQSSILTPSDVGFARDGVAAEAPPNVETVLVQELDLQQLRRHRRAGAVRPYTDRRLDLYGVWHKGGEEPV